MPKREMSQTQRLQAEAAARAARLQAEAEAEGLRIRAEAESARLSEREKAAAIYDRHPSVLRLKELEALHELAHVANARIYIGFDKHAIADRASD